MSDEGGATQMGEMPSELGEAADAGSAGGRRRPQR
jgi:hypothetical protein